MITWATYFLCKQWSQRCNIPQEFQPSCAISAAPPYQHQFLTGGPPAERKGGRGVVPPPEKRGDRGVVPMHEHSPLTVSLLPRRTSTEEGFRGGKLWQFDRSEKLFGYNQQSEEVVMLMDNEEKNKNNINITIDDGDGETRSLCLDTHKITVKWWLGKSIKTLN